MIGTLGIKLGMTQVVDPGGRLVPVTVIQTGPAVVTRIRTKDKDGYEAVQLGLGEIREKHLTGPRRGQFAKSGVTPRRHLCEFRLDERPINGGEKKLEFSVGQNIGCDIFQEGEFVNVRGRTIGKGFQGVVRRWRQHGGPESHGSMHHRRLGSAGASSFPSGTWRGHHMPGHMGSVQRTCQNLLVLKVMKEDQVILVRGAVPGKRDEILTLTRSFKKKKIDLADLAQIHEQPSAAAKTKKPAKKPAAPKK